VTVSEDFAAALAAAGYDVQFATFDGGHARPPAETLLPVHKELLGLKLAGPGAPRRSAAGNDSLATAIRVTANARRAADG
jgi:hypothetical protein